MVVSIFGHLEFEQGELLERRTVHNDDRVSAPEREGSGHLSACQTTVPPNEAKMSGTEKEKQICRYGRGH